jgi:hypothetical protein
VRIFIDCEFNSAFGQLISMALVAEDGREFYEVLPPPIRLDPWVEKNVMPILDKGPISWVEFWNRLFRFLDGFDNPTIVADHPADIFYLADALIVDRVGGCYKKPWTAQYRDVDYTSGLPHNALEDARALFRHYTGDGLNRSGG